VLPTKEETARAIKIYRIIALVDVISAFACAANGDSHFVFFAVLGGIMWAMAIRLESKNDETGE
jgi:hypothetical protein